MQRFSIHTVKGTNRIRVVDDLTGLSEEVVATEDTIAQIARRPAAAVSFMVPREPPSMKVCVFGS